MIQDMYYWKYYSVLLLFHQVSAFQDITDNITFHDPAEMGIDMRSMSLTTYASLVNESSGKMRFESYVADAEVETRKFFEWFPLKHWGAEKDIIYACYYIQTTYANAMTDIRRYFSRRTLYKSTLEYEVGYLTHEVIWRYRTILELYHYLTYWLQGYPTRNFAPTVLVFYMYTNVVQHSIAIINLCNMLHEIEKKYRGPREKGVFDDYGLNQGKGTSGNIDKQKHNKTIADLHLAAYEEYLRRLKQEAKRKKKEAKEMRKEVLKLGKTTTRGKATPKKSRWPLQYGWSIEDW